MDRIKTLVVNDGILIKDADNSIELTNDYIELLPKNKFIRYLKLNVIFKNYRDSISNCLVPIVLINGEKCPIQIQTDFEINANTDMVIESLMINKDFYVGHMMYIECDNYLVK